jgi:hypothetical protein
MVSFYQKPLLSGESPVRGAKGFEISIAEGKKEDDVKTIRGPQASSQ